MCIILSWENDADRYVKGIPFPVMMSTPRKLSSSLSHAANCNLYKYHQQLFGDFFMFSRSS